MITDSEIPVTTAAKQLCVSRRGFYKWKGREKRDNDEELRRQILEIATEFPKYGYRRVTHELLRRGKRVNHKKVFRLMKENKLLVRRTKRFYPKTTQSNHHFGTSPNLIRHLKVTATNQVFVADITYIRLSKGFVYLASIMDIFSRRCVGWALSLNPNTQLTLDALEKAVALRGEYNLRGCIHHSDHGVQYASNNFISRLQELGMRSSMGEIGNSYENAHAESFFKTLKVEEVWMNEYACVEDVYENIERFIERVYNKKRLHSSIGYMPPIEFEEKQDLLGGCET